MTIKEIKEEIELASHPIAKSLHTNNNFKVLVIGFKKGMTLKKHKANAKTKLTVLEGEVVYSEEDNDVILKQYMEHEIPVEIFHSVKANDASLCLLTQERQ